MANDRQSYVFCLFLVFFSAFTYSSYAHQFTVGGKDGWALNPSENYNHWAERMRFQVYDTLLFKYKKGSDSVLVVHKDDYDQCNTGKPIVKLEDGNSVFKFYRSGPFFFIGGNKSNCANGQKLIVVVLAVRNHPSPPPKAPSPAAPPKGSSHSPAPQGEAPASASSPSSPSPPDEAPAPATGLGPSPNSGSDTPADVNAAGQPLRRSFSTPACSTPSVVLVSTVSLVLNVFLGGFIVSL